MECVVTGVGSSGEMRQERTRSGRRSSGGRRPIRQCTHYRSVGRKFIRGSLLSKARFPSHLSSHPSILHDNASERGQVRIQILMKRQVQTGRMAIKD